MPATKRQRPKRQKMGDRLLNVGASQERIRCDYAVAPFDRAAWAMDSKWGVDVLPELVSPETASKYGIAVSKLNEAIEAADAEKTEKWAMSCIRGLKAMDEEATASGAQPASEACLSVEDDQGNVYHVMHDPRAWPRIKEANPDLETVTPREVAIALTFWKEHKVGTMSEAVKEHFPEAEVVAFRRKDEDDQSATS